ncbi:MAG TPA: GDSL-type esterase/lipase family protein [Vicinamibacterales bacterium]|nr:GDSL-type esterase/lipase family protein [Vicinamibacterales bacterium]
MRSIVGSASWLGVFIMLACGAGRAAAQTAAQPAPPPLPDCPDVARAMRDLMGQDARLRDWPNLTRYRMANDELQESAAAVPVVFLGDSITDRWDDEGSGGFFPGKHYVNRGIGGQTTPQMLIRLRPDVLSHSPKGIVLLAGTNDIAGNTGPESDEDIEQNIAAIAELSAANGAKVVLAGILPISDYHQKPDQVPQTVRRPMSRITAVNAWMRKYAADHGHVFLDYTPGVADSRGMLKADFSDDDLHPNAQGYAAMAPFAEAAIAQAMK